VKQQTLETFGANSRSTEAGYPVARFSNSRSAVT
jgi:hypothetical protein